MPGLALGDSPSTETPKKPTRLEIAATVAVALFVLALFFMVASTTYTWLSSGTH